MAADALKACGGGTIELSEGIFDITGPVRLFDNITLTGQGRKTVLKKSAGFSSTFLEDVDYGVFSARPVSISGFAPGMGLLIKDSISSGGWSVSTSKVTAIEGDTVYFDRRTLMDYTRENEGVISNACSIIEAIKANNVQISNLSIDGTKDSNIRMDGCRSGAIYLHKVVNCKIDDVLVYDFNGDGISWQITEDISVRNSEVYGCTGFGLHPGTGSERSVVAGCRLHENGSDGLFICWRVRNGIFRNNSIFNNGSSGICIGHKDTDNLFEGNHIFGNGIAGIQIRNEAEGNRADRNIYRGNTIEDNGNAVNGNGFIFLSEVEGNVIEDNIIRDTGAGMQKAGICCCGSSNALSIGSNEMDGHQLGNITEFALP